MPTTEAMEGKQSRNAATPRWVFVVLGLFAWLVGMPLVHGMLPWALSSLTARHGWMGGRPGIWNLLGLIPLAVGAALLSWDFACGMSRVREIPNKVAGLSFPILLTRGPYAFSRNPMYLGELALWLGWSILFGSAAVLLGLVILTAAMAAVVPREERALETRFGPAYRQYKATVPRWLGKIRR